jgi:hypothetical protein
LDLDADDGVVAFEVDPVAPRFGFVAGIQVFLAKRGEHFDEVLGGADSGSLTRVSMGEGAMGGNSWAMCTRFTPEV